MQSQRIYLNLWKVRTYFTLFLFWRKVNKFRIWNDKTIRRNFSTMMSVDTSKQVVTDCLYGTGILSWSFWHFLEWEKYFWSWKFWLLCNVYNMRDRILLNIAETKVRDLIFNTTRPLIIFKCLWNEILPYILLIALRRSVKIIMWLLW